jgi:hypothetical protein
MKARYQSRRVPAEIRLLLGLSGWLLPRTTRRDWSREWLTEFSEAFSRGHQQGARQRWRMFMRACGAIPDVWTLLQLHGFRQRLAEAVHSRVTPVVVFLLALVILAVTTSNFQQARALVFEPDSDNLVLLLQPVPFMGGSCRVPVAQAELWERAGTTVDALGVWTIEDRAIQGQNVRVWKATPAALELFAQSRVKPQHDLVEISGKAPFAGIIAKLRPRATAREAEAELAETAKLRKEWLSPQVVSLAAIRRAPLIPIAWLLGGLWFICAVSIRIRSLQACLWALAPLTLCFVTIAAAWLECVARAPVTEVGRIPEPWNVAVYVVPVAVASGAAWCSHRVAGRRCRTCYRPLMAGVSVGMEGRCIFEPGGSEYLCAEGHGSLIVGLAAQHKSDEVWVSWSSSWA